MCFIGRSHAVLLISVAVCAVGWAGLLVASHPCVAPLFLVCVRRCRKWNQERLWRHIVAKVRSSIPRAQAAVERSYAAFKGAVDKMVPSLKLAVAVLPDHVKQPAVAASTLAFAKGSPSESLRLLSPAARLAHLVSALELDLPAWPAGLVETASQCPVLPLPLERALLLEISLRNTVPEPTKPSTADTAIVAAKAALWDACVKIETCMAIVRFAVAVESKFAVQPAVALAASADKHHELLRVDIADLAKLQAEFVAACRARDRAVALLNSLGCDGNAQTLLRLSTSVAVDAAVAQLLRKLGGLLVQKELALSLHGMKSSKSSKLASLKQQLVRTLGGLHAAARLSTSDSVRNMVLPTDPALIHGPLGLSCLLNQGAHPDVVTAAIFPQLVLLMLRAQQYWNRVEVRRAGLVGRGRGRQA